MAPSALPERLCIPVLDADDVVVVNINNQLPEEPEEILEILAAEAAPLSTWFDFARAYLAQGKEQAFVHICTEGVKEEVTQEVERFFGRKPTYEQIQFLCGLASLSIGKAKDEKEKQKKQDYLSQANKWLQQARMLDPNEQLVHLATGMLHLSKGETLQARQAFSKASQHHNNGRVNVVGFLALGSVMFSEKQYKEALTMYRRALSEHPGCPPEVRLGIAACQFRLGDLAAAEAAYKRVLVLDPDNGDAHLGLAVIKFNSPNVQQGLADGLKLLVRAFELDPTSVGALALLSHYCLVQGQYEKVLVLTRSALEVVEGEGVRADVLCQQARAQHALGLLNEAAASYTQAARLDPQSPLPHLGLAQMNLRQGGESGAINASSELENALKCAPAFYDALKILGQLIFDNPAKVHKTMGHFKEAAAKQSDDADIWELLGELSAPTDPAGSLKSYNRALEIHRGKQAEVVKAREAAAAARAERKAQKANDVDDLFGSDDEDDDDDEADAGSPDHIIPARLLNNAAVLMYRAGDVAGAHALLREAVAGAASNSELTSAHRTALSFNLARLQEASGDYSAATEGYKAILSHTPDYIDCYLRLACVMRHKGAVGKALDWARQALSRVGGHADALALMAQLHTERREYAEADKVLKQLMRPDAAAAAAAAGPSGAPAPKGPDPYGLLCLGNLCLATAPTDRRKDEAARKAEGQLLKALDHYRNALRMDPHNVYAANGVGAALAELGRLDEAKEVLEDVQAAVASHGYITIPDLYVNLANVALAKQEYASALRLYALAKGKVDAGKQSLLLLYLARGYYDCDDLKSAKSCLMRAIHVAPTDYKLRFNAALIMQEWAVRVYRKKRPDHDPTKLPDYEKAAKELEMALTYFEHLDSMGVDRTKLDPVKLKTHVQFCSEQVKKAAAYVEAARHEAEEMATKREAQDKMRVMAEAKRRYEELQREALAQKEKLDRERRAKEALQKQERLKEEWRLKRGEPEAAEDGEGGGKKRKSGGAGGKKKGGKKGRDAGREGSEEEDEEEVGGARGGEREVGDAEIDQLFGDDEDEEGAAAEADMLRQAGLGSDDDDEELGGPSGRAAEAAPRAGGRLRKRTRAAEEEGEEGEAAGVQGGGDEAVARDGLEDEEDEGAGAAAQPSKRSRRAAIDEEEEEEGGAAGGAGQPEAAAAEQQQRTDADVDALFGDDDDE